MRTSLAYGPQRRHQSGSRRRPHDPCAGAGSLDMPVTCTSCVPLSCWGTKVRSLSPHLRVHHARKDEPIRQWYRSMPWQLKMIQSWLTPFRKMSLSDFSEGRQEGLARRSDNAAHNLVECWTSSFSCCLRYLFTARATDTNENCGIIAGQADYEGVEVLICSENGAPGAIPTRDLPLRRRTLYAAELREHR